MTGIAYYNLFASDGTTATAQLGQEINVKGATWKYVKASATVTAYQACGVAAAQTCAPLTTTTAGVLITAEVVIPQFAFASGDYGWAPVGPFALREDDATPFYVLAAASDVLGVAQYTTATDGVVDDSATTVIHGLRLTATITGAAAAACTAATRLTLGT